MKKRKPPKRPRQVPSLQERELARRPNEPEKPKGRILPFNPTAPLILVTEDTRFINIRQSVNNFPWKKLTFTFILIFLGGVGSAAFQARNANIEGEVRRAMIETQRLQAENFSLESQLQERYTRDEIERIAITELGMFEPDASQIININVPRVGTVNLNNAEYAIPQQNYFRNDVADFFSETINKIFGGR